MRGFKKILDFVLDILFPPFCLFCGKYLEKDVCAEPICRICSDKIIVKRYPERINGLTLRAAADYRDKNIKFLICSLKYKNISSASMTLGRILAEHLLSENIDPEKTIIVPIPLHPIKERRRGYNQSVLIAEEVGKRLGIPVEKKILRRIKSGKSQASLDDYNDRMANIRGAFTSGKDNHLTAKKTIILVDDVCTSGATMKEALREIRKMRPKRIIPAAVAIAK